MGLPTKHLRHQLPVLASLGGTALSALRQSLGAGGPRARSTELPVVPGPEHRQTLAPRPPDLVRDYVVHLGGDPAAYRGTVPAHLFPQWGFPLAARALRGIPYPLHKVLNGGCRLECNGALPGDEPLVATARLEGIDDNGRRAVLHQRVATGPLNQPDAVVAHLYAIVPLAQPREGRAGATTAPAPAKPRVPAGARELARWRLGRDAGLAFAMLTGDFNPVHWVPPYARAFGFRGTILHGFATMARAIEGLNRGLFAKDPTQIASFDCKFTRPLPLPANVGLYVGQERVYVGDAPGGPAYLVGSFSRIRA